MERPSPVLTRGDSDERAVAAVLHAALPIARNDESAARVAAEALIALARLGADSVVADVLRRGVRYDVRHSYGSDSVGGAAIAGLDACDALRCFAHAVEEDPGARIELVTYDSSANERVVMIAASGQAPKFVVPEIAWVRPEVTDGQPVQRDDAPPTTLQPVAALAEVLAHLPSRDEIVDAVRAGLSDAAVVVDLPADVAAPLDTAGLDARVERLEAAVTQLATAVETMSGQVASIRDRLDSLHAAVVG